ncbi:MAG: hypothetical protein ACYDAQ_18635 [Mycobacteriales bacterium]
MVGTEIWREMDMWQRWSESGRKAAEFQRWLDGCEANLGGFARRAALGRSKFEVVRESLERHLST